MDLTPLRDQVTIQEANSAKRHALHDRETAGFRGEAQAADQSGARGIVKNVTNGAATNGQHITFTYESQESQPIGSHAMVDSTPTISTTPDGTIALAVSQHGHQPIASNAIASGPSAPTSQATMPAPLGPPPKRPIGRPRGSKTRGVTKSKSTTGRNGKRKRRSGSAKDDDDASTSDSEIATPTTTLTKSGRTISKPTTYIPPPAPSPTTQPIYKRRKPASRKNPESAVCKLCLRGVSPAGNMIVFCDGCNTPYHRWCHKPPTAQEVIEEVEREWFCRVCERERIEPVEEGRVEGFVAAPGVGALDRQKYFSSLPPGLLVTLLTRATTLQPDLPMFEPSFVAKAVPAPSTRPPDTNGHGHPAAPKPTPPLFSPSGPQAEQSRMVVHDMNDSDDGYGSDTHPSHYPRPGQGLMSMLPPESEDLHFLVDDESSRGVFTHLYQARTGAENGATSAGAQR
ncbi:hypothetical protein LTR95_011566 [Oleoguttula sp. CCFEE 5521]